MESKEWAKNSCSIFPENTLSQHFYIVGKHSNKKDMVILPVIALSQFQKPKQMAKEDEFFFENNFEIVKRTEIPLMVIDSHYDSKNSRPR